MEGVSQTAGRTTAQESGCPVHSLGQDFKPFALAEPYEFYARARREEPVFWSEELGYWVVSRYEDILAIFKDPERFSSENTQEPYAARPAEVTEVLEKGGFRAYSGLSARQPPDHTRLRGFVKKAFTPRRVETLEPDIRELARTMIERFADRGHADLVSELARDLPAMVIFRLLGIPDTDAPNVKKWARSRVYLNFGGLPVDEQVEHAENLVAYWRYCVELVESRFDRPGDDLPTDLVRIHKDGDDSISIDEMAGLVYGQLTAGHETTTALLAEGLKELIAQPGRWKALCENPELNKTAVEEMLRISTPVFAWKRRTLKPAEVAGVEIPRGSNVLLLLGSANHDDAVFPEPESIDLERENARQHLSFGQGIHFCLGAALARLEARVVLEELTQRLPGLELVPGQRFDYSANTSFRCPAEVHVEWPIRGAAPGHTVALHDQGSERVGLVGGKAASLNALIRAELPVPEGFAVTTQAFAGHLERDGLGQRIRDQLQSATDGDHSALEEAAGRIRAMVEESPMPAETAEAIRAGYEDLEAESDGPVPVAVRSSATAEDSAEASFAGQQDTFLWVLGPDEVVAHVKRCWASLYTARSISYRRDQRIGEDEVEMGVVVQRMVSAQAAGVAMTLDPSSGDRSKIAIEASFGLGEAVVSGTVTPDSFLLDKVVLEPVKTTIARKEVEVVPDPSGRGVVTLPIPAERQSRASLTTGQVEAVGRLAKAAERHFGCPQDVEWALDAQGESIVLLQSRPETAWANKAADSPRPSAGYATGLDGIVQTLVNPIAGRRKT